ncbi:AEC family transporter [Marinomonas piezotolerans]|uniref:AEC family transporter n=1 Tax=Marinomonas piezotolerans TaxID=2213058 RepID=A0A370U505_9GAMM|nr:AEC family transporter [Marinomonas piezotolerans]RDL42864.1 AEC family transporter [Marinomonas piezotolerans]
MATADIFQQIFNTVFPLLMIVMIGFFYARARPTDMTIANRINMSVFIPALIFSVMASKDFNIQDYSELILAGAVVIIGSGIVAWPIARWLGYEFKTFVPPMMFNNSGNLGIPLMVLAFGESALPIAVVLFLTENLLHFTVGMYLLNPRTNLTNLLKMPIIIATALGVLWSLQGWQVPQAIGTGVDMLGQISIPLMLFALGVRMKDVDFGQWRIGVISGFLCPLSGVVMAYLYYWTVGIREEWFGYLLIFACLPPAVLNYMLAEVHQQEPQKVATIVLLGNLMALLCIPIVLYFVL